MFCSFYFYLLLWGQYNSAAWGPRDQWLLVTGIRRTCNFDLLNRPPQFFGQFLSNYRKPKIVEKNWNKNRINLEPKKSVFYKYFKSGRKKLSNPVIQLCFARSPLWPFQNFDWQSVVGWVIFYLPPSPLCLLSPHARSHTFVLPSFSLPSVWFTCCPLALSLSQQAFSFTLSFFSLSLSLSLSLTVSFSSLASTVFISLSQILFVSQRLLSLCLSGCLFLFLSHSLSLCFLTCQPLLSLSL